MAMPKPLPAVELCFQAETMQISGINSPTTLQREMVAGRHPLPIKVSANRNAWVKSELVARIQAKIESPRDTRDPRNPAVKRRRALP